MAQGDLFLGLAPVVLKIAGALLMVCRTATT